MIAIASTFILVLYLHIASPFADQLNAEGFGKIDLIIGVVALVVFTFFTEVMIRIAFNPQIDDFMDEKLEAELRELSRSQIIFGSVDPDYRRRGWNQSRFAPKNRVTTSGMTQIAFGRGALLMLLPLLTILIVRGFELDASLFLLWPVFALGTLFNAVLIRRAEWRRVRDKLIVEYEMSKSARAVVASAHAGFPNLRPSDVTLLSRMNYREFEHEVARIIEHQTGLRTEVVGGASDGGVDIKVFNRSRKLVGIVQCKRHKPDDPLPPMYIRELNAVKEFYRVQTAYLVTTARFSDDSRRIAMAYGIRLIDGKTLERLRWEMLTGVDP